MAAHFSGGDMGSDNIVLDGFDIHIKSDNSRGWPICQ
jgi:hypothetical protein